MIRVPWKQSAISAPQYPRSASAPLSATCLEQGLALVMLLTLDGVPAQLVLGVSRTPPALRAHAWVECEGAIVHGGAEARGFAPLLSPTPPASSSPVVSSCPG